MNLRKTALAWILVATGALLLCSVCGACGEHVEAGLANAPSLERKSEPRQDYDVITSGEEGCVGRDGGATVESRTNGCRSNLGSGKPVDAGDPQVAH